MAQSASYEVFAPGMRPQDPVEYDKWFRAQVQAALDDPRPSIPPCTGNGGNTCPPRE